LEGLLEAQRWKYKVSGLIDATEQFDKILFLDADCLALRNIDHLLDGDWDIRYQPERQRPGNEWQFNTWFTAEEMAAAAKLEGVNSGTFAVRGAVFHEVMEAWARIDTGTQSPASGLLEQAAWNALLLRNNAVGLTEVSPGVALGASRWKAEPFPMGEVQFPGLIDLHPASYTRAAITHNIMPELKEKVAFTFGLYMRTFYTGRMRALLELLEGQRGSLTDPGSRLVSAP